MKTSNKFPDLAGSGQPQPQVNLREIARFAASEIRGIQGEVGRESPELKDVVNRLSDETVRQINDVMLAYERGISREQR